MKNEDLTLLLFSNDPIALFYCPGSREIRTPYPEDIKCFWCDTVSECKGCGRTISREMRPTCIDWCPEAKECVGIEKYERLMKSRCKCNGGVDGT